MSKLVRLALLMAVCVLVQMPVTEHLAPHLGAQTTWPAARSGAHAMAFDQRRGLIYLYGDRAADASVLWAWDGRGWRSFDQPGPGLRRHIKLAYDTGRDRLVLYGGYDNGGVQIHADTWEWDGQRWSQIATEGPGPRSSYSFVYDPQRRKIVLFGGLTPDGPGADTWEWDGRQWTKIADEGPSARGEAGALFDSQSGRILLSGGMAYSLRTLPNGRRTISLQRDQMPHDTWTLEGTRWRLLSAAGSARMAPLAPDPRSGRPLRIGGESSGGTFHGDLWQWKNGAWELVPGAEIPARHGAAAALDTRRKRLVVFGGFAQGTGPLADLWEWDGTRWYQIAKPQ